MGFPDKVLADDEKVVDHLHPHWVTLVPGVLGFIVICTAAGFAIGYAPSSGTTHSVFIWVVVVVAVLLLMWLTLRPVIRWKTSHYVFTDHRVLIRTGVLRRTGRDIALRNISDVGFSQSLWDRVVGAGTLSIESASENGRSVLEDVPHSERQQQLINRLIEQDADRRAREAAEHHRPDAQAPGTESPSAQGPTQGYAPTRQLPPTE